MVTKKLISAISGLAVIISTAVCSANDDIDDYVKAGKLKWYQPSDQRLVAINHNKATIKKSVHDIHKLARYIARQNRIKNLVLCDVYARKLEAAATIYLDTFERYPVGIITTSCREMQYYAIKLRHELRNNGMNILDTKKYKNAMKAIDHLCRLSGLRKRSSQSPDMEMEVER